MIWGVCIPILLLARPVVPHTNGTLIKNALQENEATLLCDDCPARNHETPNSGVLIEQREARRDEAPEGAAPDAEEPKDPESLERDVDFETDRARDITEGQLFCAITVFLFAVVALPFFYVATASNVDLAGHSWTILEVVVGVFIAVLFYSAVHALLRHQFSSQTIAVDIGEAVFYLLMLELVLVLASQGNDRAWNVVKMRSFGILFAHLAGFSALELASEVTVRGMHGHHSWVPAGVILGTFVVFVVILWSIAYVRFKTHMDGEVYSAAEKEMAHHSEHCETAAAGLCLGFLIVQAVKFYAVNDLITGMVGEERNLLHTRPQSTILWITVVIAILVAFLVGVAGYQHSHTQEQSPGEIEAPGIISLSVHILDETTIFTAGICAMYAVRWEVQRRLDLPKADVVPDLVTFSVSAQIAFGLICLMTIISMLIRRIRRKDQGRGAVFGSVLRPERVAEEARTQQGRDMINHGLFNLIQALGVLFGFSMERTYEAALEDLSFVAGEEAAGHEKRSSGFCDGKCQLTMQLVKWGGAVLLSLLIFPALLFTIVPTSIKKNEIASRELGLKKLKGRMRASMFDEDVNLPDEYESDESETVNESPSMTSVNEFRQPTPRASRARASQPSQPTQRASRAIPREE